MTQLRLVGDGTRAGTYLVDVETGRLFSGVSAVRWTMGRQPGEPAHRRHGEMTVTFFQRPPCPKSEWDGQFSPLSRHLVSTGEWGWSDLIEDGSRIRGVQSVEFRLDAEQGVLTYVRLDRNDVGERVYTEFVWDSDFSLDVRVGDSARIPETAGQDFGEPELVRNPSLDGVR